MIYQTRNILLLIVFIVSGETLLAQELGISCSRIFGSGTIRIVDGILLYDHMADTTRVDPAVEMVGLGAGSNMLIDGPMGVPPIRLNVLRVTGAGKLNVRNLIVADSLTLGTNGNPWNGEFSLGLGGTIEIRNASSWYVPNLGTMYLTDGTVRFNSSGGVQAVLNTPAGISYGSLFLAGSSPKSLQTGGSMRAQTITQTGGDLDVTENLEVTNSLSFTSLRDLSAGKRLSYYGPGNATIATMNNSQLGTLEMRGTSDLTIGSLVANNGNIRTFGGKTSFQVAAQNSGTISADTGTVEFQGNVNNAGGVISAQNTGTIEFGGDVSTTPGSFNLAAASTVIYDGATQTVAGGVSYGNLWLAGTGPKLAVSGFTVAGTIRLDETLTLAGSTAVTMTSSVASNVQGPMSISGRVGRIHNFAADSSYRFNSATVFLRTQNQVSGDITLFMRPDSIPSNPSSGYVRRYYYLTPSNSGNLLAIQLQYDPAELVNISDETKLGIKSTTDNGATWNKLAEPGYSRTSGGGIVLLSGLNTALGGVGRELGIFRSNEFVTVADNSNVSLPSGWDEGSVPTATDDAIVNHVDVYTGSGSLVVNNLLVNAGKSIRTEGDSLSVLSTATIDGRISLTNSNAYLDSASVIGSGGIYIAAGRVLRGISHYFNTTGVSTFTGDYDVSNLTVQSGSITFGGMDSDVTNTFSNMGSLTITGRLSIATMLASTTTSGGSLTLSGASSIMNVGALGMASSLSITGGSLVLDHVNSVLNVYGNLLIGAGVNAVNEGTISVPGQ